MSVQTIFTQAEELARWLRAMVAKSNVVTPQDPYGGRRALPPASYHVTSTCAPSTTGAHAHSKYKRFLFFKNLNSWVLPPEDETDDSNTSDDLRPRI